MPVIELISSTGRAASSDRDDHIGEAEGMGGVASQTEGRRGEADLMAEPGAEETR